MSPIKEIEQFITILIKTNPGLSGCCSYDISATRTKDHLPWFYEEMYEEMYTVSFNFPIYYRNEVIKISKFCGINFEYEFYDYQEGTIRFETEYKDIY